MLTHRLIPLRDKERWEQSLNSLPHSVTHTHGYNAALAQSHEGDVYLYVGEDEEAHFKTICPFKFRPIDQWVDVVTPYGLSGFTSTRSYPHFTTFFQEFCQDQKWVCGYVLQHPMLPMPDAFSITAGRTFLFLNLKDSLKDIFKNFSSTHRYEIRRSEDSITLITNDTPQTHQELRAAFLTLYQETTMRVQANALYHFTSQSLLSFLNNPQCLIIGAQHKGTIVAISLFLISSTHGDYFLNASTSDGRIFSKNILWQACQILKERGVHTFNLGGGIREGDPLEQFKHRFGAQKFVTPRLQFIFQPSLYAHLCAQSPAHSASYFPLYRACESVAQ